ncbi:MAG: hypothetical protein JAY90_20080 [Candidatus Thiodiazotropha lotti]|nr:hypothetical protein [Candidatus Thiodiazotropha lotti]
MLRHISTYIPPYYTREQAKYLSIQKQSVEEWLEDYKEVEAKINPPTNGVDAPQRVNDIQEAV